jgi:polysaccharide biosynthesis protein PslH
MRILLLTPILPVPPVTGDRQRTWHLHKALQSFGTVEIALVGPVPPLDRESVFTTQRSWGLVRILDKDARVAQPRSLRAKTVDRARKFASPLADYGAVPGAQADLADLLNYATYDCVVIRYFHTAAITGVIDLHTRCYLDMDDYEPARYASLIGGAGPIRKVYLRRKSRQLARYFAETAPRFRGIWVANPDDRMKPELRTAIVLPNVPFASSDGVPISTTSDSNPVLLAVTSSNQGNIDGLRHFARFALPSLVGAVPGLRLRVVGSNIDRDLRDQMERVAGVEYVGRVADLQVEYSRCAVSIAPVLSGAGTSIKVLESFAYGRPCVMNTFAARGLDDLPVKLRSKLCADNIEGMAPLIIELIQNGELRKRLSAELRAWVSNNRTSDQVLEAVAAHLKAPERLTS